VNHPQTGSHVGLALPMACAMMLLSLACTVGGGVTGVAPTVTPYIAASTLPPTDLPAEPTAFPESTDLPELTQTPQPVSTVEPSAEPTSEPTIPPPTPEPTAVPAPSIVRVYASREAVGATEVFVEYDDGTVVNVTNHPAEDGYPDLSPDGTKIVFASTRAGGPALIHVMNVDGTEVVQLTDAPSGDTLPVWSPDGTKIAFQALRDGNYEIYVMNADGTGQTNLTNHPGKDLQPSWSPDGTQIYFQTDRNGNMYDDYVMNADGTGQMPRP
jgi:dipeptidyl aminopeptidase/acylaminoacyl peptidase